MYHNKNQLVGFDIDVSTKLAAMLGVKVTYVTVDPNSRVPFITSGRVDIVMGGMTRTPDRAKLIDFTLPIMTESLGALSIEGKPFKNLGDLDKDSVTLAEVRGTTPIPWIAANLPHAKVLLLDNHPDVLRAVAQGRADAVVDDLASLGEVAKKIDAKWMPLQGHAKEVDWDCIGVNRGDLTLKSWLNVAVYCWSRATSSSRPTRNGSASTCRHRSRTALISDSGARCWAPRVPAGDMMPP